MLAEGEGEGVQEGREPKFQRRMIGATGAGDEEREEGVCPVLAVLPKGNRLALVSSGLATGGPNRREEEGGGSGEGSEKKSGRPAESGGTAKEARDLFIQDDTDMQVPQMRSGAELGELGRARPAGARQRGKAGARRSARSGLTSTGTRRGSPGGALGWLSMCSDTRPGGARLVRS